MTFFFPLDLVTNFFTHTFFFIFFICTKIFINTVFLQKFSLIFTYAKLQNSSFKMLNLIILKYVKLLGVRYDLII